MEYESYEPSKKPRSNGFIKLIKHIKRIIKLIFGYILGTGTVNVKSSEWMEAKALEYMDKTKKKIDIDIDTNIDFTTSYPQYSAAVESAINSLIKGRYRILNSYRYTEKRILVIKNPYKYAPLCALAIFNTASPCSVKVLVKGKTADCDYEYETEAATAHRVPIVALYADWDNTVTLTVKDSDGKEKFKKEFNLHIPKLKGKDAEIKITSEVNKTKYLYDFTLVYGGDDGISPYAFDRNTDLRFCFGMVPKTYGFQPIRDGKFLFLNKGVTRLTFTNPTSTQLMEVDQIGRVLKIYNFEKGVHHDFAELENGNLVMGSSAVDGGTYEDSVIEVDRKTGNIVNEVCIKDYIDPKFVDSPDWAHLNTLEYDDKAHTVMVCLRNLHSVIKIDYAKKELLWIMANPLFWKGSAVEDKVLKPIGDDMEWFYQQHAAYFLDEDLDGDPDTKHLIMYDNHNQARRKVNFYDNKKESYVRIYAVNEKEKTVKLEKSYPTQWSTIRSNAVFESKAGRIIAMSGKLKKASENRASLVTEFDFETGEELNKFAINHGYYRAYPFEFACKELAKSVKVNRKYELGKNYPLIPCDGIDVSIAEEVPEPVLEDCYESETDRREKLIAASRKNFDLYVDPKQDMARIRLKIRDDTLYATLIDHLLLGIYFVGKNNTYLRDFSDTRQERPEYFNRAVTTDPIPLEDMKADEYQIYYKHKEGLFKSKYYLNIS